MFKRIKQLTSAFIHGETSDTEDIDESEDKFFLEKPIHIRSTSQEGRTSQCLGSIISHILSVILGICGTLLYCENSSETSLAFPQATIETSSIIRDCNFTTTKPVISTTSTSPPSASPTTAHRYIFASDPSKYPMDFPLEDFKSYPGYSALRGHDLKMSFPEWYAPIPIFHDEKSRNFWMHPNYKKFIGRTYDGLDKRNFFQPYNETHFIYKGIDFSLTIPESSAGLVHDNKREGFSWQHFMEMSFLPLMNHWPWVKNFDAICLEGDNMTQPSPDVTFMLKDILGVKVKTGIKKGQICPGATFNPILSLYPGTHNENAYPSLCDYAHKHVFKQLDVQRKSYEELVKSKECKYVFIPRQSGHHRALPNRAKVEALFKELFGSKAVISEDSANLRDQLLFLKDACVVVSVHGGALYRSFFAPVGAHVFEIQNTYWGYGTFWALNSCVGHRYHFMKNGDPKGNSFKHETHRIPMEDYGDPVDIALLRSALMNITRDH